MHTVRPAAAPANAFDKEALVPHRYLEMETERVKEKGVENRKKADIHAAYTPHFLFLQLLELSVPQHSQRKKEQDLHSSSRHSARNTLLGQYFCNSLSTEARLLVLKNANQLATASLSRRQGARGS